MPTAATAATAMSSGALHELDDLALGGAGCRLSGAGRNLDRSVHDLPFSRNQSRDRRQLGCNLWSTPIRDCSPTVIPSRADTLASNVETALTWRIVVLDPFEPDALIDPRIGN